MILAIPVFFLVLIQFIPLQIEVQYRRTEDDHFLVTAVKMFSRLRVTRIKIVLNKGARNKGNRILVLLRTHLFRTRMHPQKRRILDEIADFVQFLFRSQQKLAYYTLFRRLLGKTQCHNLRWVTEIGLTDPATTGIAPGSLWTLKSMVVQQICRLMVMKARKLDLQVIPNFFQPKLRLDFQCIFALRLGYITNAFFGLIWLLIRERKAGKG